MKKLVVLVFLIIATLTTSVLAETNNTVNQPTDQIFLSTEENDNFNNTIANVTPDTHMVVESYKRKQKNNKSLPDIEAKDVKASENIKIYAFSNIKSSDFYNDYEKNSNLDSFIAEQNAIITVYRDSKKQLIDSILFIKNPESTEPTINGWGSVSSGAFILSQETIEFLSDKKNIKNLLDTLNVKNPKDLKVVVGIEGLNAALYLKENGQQIIIPLSDGIAYDENISTCKKFTPYLASEFFKARKTSALENQKKGEEEALKPVLERRMGASDPINYENLQPINLLTINTLEINKTSNYNYYPIIISSSIVAVCIFLGFLYKRKSLNH